MQFIVSVYLRILGLYYIPACNRVLGTLALKYISTIPIEHDLESLPTYSQAKAWIEDCVVNHSKCLLRQDICQMPLRVIDVGLSKSNIPDIVKVHATSDESADYMTLSYCWGSSKQDIVPTEDQLVEWTTLGIPVIHLLQTI